jgi:hypothetical protein
MKKLALIAVAVIGSYSCCMESTKALSADEKAAAGFLLHDFIYQVRKEQKSEELSHASSPVRPPYKALTPNIKKEHRDAVLKTRREKWTPEKLRTLRRCLFPCEITTEGKEKEVVTVD